MYHLKEVKKSTRYKTEEFDGKQVIWERRRGDKWVQRRQEGNLFKLEFTVNAPIGEGQK